MSLTKLTENLNNISSLEDKPSIDSTELKQKFDKAGNDIKTYINNILTDEIDELIANVNQTINTKVNELNTTITNKTNTISTAQLNKIYPVGSIYMSVNSTSPASFIGGTWERIQGRFLVGAGNNGASGNANLNLTAGTSGGESKHTLTVNEIPSHYHGSAVGDVSSSRVASYSQGANMIIGSIGNIKATNSTGGGQAHNNMPPYLAVYMWKRTS